MVHKVLVDGLGSIQSTLVKRPPLATRSQDDEQPRHPTSESLQTSQPGEQPRPPTSESPEAASGMISDLVGHSDLFDGAWDCVRTESSHEIAEYEKVLSVSLPYMEATGPLTASSRFDRLDFLQAFAKQKEEEWQNSHWQLTVGGHTILG